MPAWMRNAKNQEATVKHEVRVDIRRYAKTHRVYCKECGREAENIWTKDFTYDGIRHMSWLKRVWRIING